MIAPLHIIHDLIVAITSLTSMMWILEQQLLPISVIGFDFKWAEINMFQSVIQTFEISHIIEEDLII